MHAVQCCPVNSRLKWLFFTPVISGLRNQCLFNYKAGLFIFIFLQKPLIFYPITDLLQKEESKNSEKRESLGEIIQT